MEKKKKRIGRPPALLWFLAYLVLYPYFRLRYGARFINRAGRIKGPALVLAPHICAKDPHLLAVALYPARPNFVMSAHFAAKPMMRRVMKWLHVIPKRMFSADIGTILNIRRAKSEGNVVALFPEGRLTCWGHSLPLAAGTAELIRNLGVPVYSVVNNGAYLTFPKWAKYPRRGRMQIVTELLFSAEEAQTLPLPELSRRLDEAMLHDEELAMAGTRYRCRDMTAGLDGILYRCPECLQEGTLTAGEGHLRCRCGMDVVLGADYRFQSGKLATVNDWYRWQESLLDPAAPLCGRVRVGTLREDGTMNPEAGEAEISLDRACFTFCGTVNGERLEFSLPTEKIGGFPITVGVEFDIHYNNRLYYLYPQPDPRMAVKWVSFLDRLHAEAAALPATPIV